MLTASQPASTRIDREVTRALGQESYKTCVTKIRLNDRVWPFTLESQIAR